MTIEHARKSGRARGTEIGRAAHVVAMTDSSRMLSRSVVSLRDLVLLTPPETQLTMSMSPWVDLYKLLGDVPFRIWKSPPPG